MFTTIRTQIKHIHVGNPFARAANALIRAQSSAEQRQRLASLSASHLSDIGLDARARSNDIVRPMIWA